MFIGSSQGAEASVVLPTDGTATVAVRGPNSMLRRILFVGGAPVASDSTEAMAHSRDGSAVFVYSCARLHRFSSP